MAPSTHLGHPNHNPKRGWSLRLFQDLVTTVHKVAALTNQEIAQARATTDNADKPAVELTLTEVGRKKLAKLTEDHQGKPLAIIVAGKVISAPIVRETIDEDKIVVSGSFTKEDVERIAEGIKKK
jgi:preprotein translocase subunit SecD